MTKEKLIEQLAELEHDQWVSWSRSVWERNGGHITSDLYKHWEKNWIPYSELSEEEKEKDRKWARKTLKIIGHNFIKQSND